ncbi:MAG: PhzF family phenazine biosynthesis protein, partial [Holosporales bacterium]|nr:PhzF family phenazine biosynthesis protein [Holosporales bacterium]
MFSLVDAFTDKPFLGNPAGVCILKNMSDIEGKMQQIATYFNWSEISYVSKISDNKYGLRWFSPKDEAPLCGHATLAAAHVVFSNNLVKGNNIEFIYNDGSLYVEKDKDNFITMSFPLKPVTKCKNIPFDVESLIGVKEYEDILKDDTMYIIVLKNHETVKNLIPRVDEIKKINTRAVVVTSRGFGDYDFCSRYFAPRVGLYEDPVCGSAHCRLAYYWGNLLGKREMIAFQSSSRTGV